MFGKQNISMGTFHIVQEDGTEIKLSENKTAEINIDYGEDESSFNLNSINSTTATISCEGTFDTVEIESLILNQNLDNVESTFTIITGYNDVQKRKHKSKRINKKWAKRYGYYQKPIYKEMKGRMHKIKADDMPNCQIDFNVGHDISDVLYKVTTEEVE